MILSPGDVIKAEATVKPNTITLTVKEIRLVEDVVLVTVDRVYDSETEVQHDTITVNLDNLTFWLGGRVWHRESSL